MDSIIVAAIIGAIATVIGIIWGRQTGYAQGLAESKSKKEVFALLKKYRLLDQPVTVMLIDRTYGDSIDGYIAEAAEHFLVMKDTDGINIRAILSWECVEHLRYRKIT